MKSKIIGITLIAIILIATTMCFIIGIREGKFKNKNNGNGKPSVAGIVLYMHTKNPVALTL